MYFYELTQIDQLILKPLFPQKQRKLSHLICLFGHQYLLKDMLKHIDLYHHNCLSKNLMSGSQALQNKAFSVL